LPGRLAARSSARLPARWAICQFRRGLLRGLTRGPG
jgi:hypothetical protein